MTRQELILERESLMTILENPDTVEPDDLKEYERQLEEIEQLLKEVYNEPEL